MENIEIIISRYNEDLHWIKEEPFNEFTYTVYNKGTNTNFEKTNVNKIIPLPNVGRCDHTYLYHITTNYDQLANITVFFPGSIHMLNKKGKAIQILNAIKNNNYQYALFIGEYTNDLYKKFKDFKLDHWLSSEENNAKLYPNNDLKAAFLRPYGKWYKYHFGNKKKIQYYTINGIFSLDKRDINQHAKFRYIFLLNQLRVHANPEVGHYIERSWSAIFYPINYTKVLLV
jgi:hypothetical protein